LREAATFYRAIDHGQRILTGHAEGSLPASQAQLDALTALVKRWTPDALSGRRIDAALHDIRQRTRQFFERTFGRG
jgi:glutamate-ammonia-ligase adenylyltransferase